VLGAADRICGVAWRRSVDIIRTIASVQALASGGRALRRLCDGCGPVSSSAAALRFVSSLREARVWRNEQERAQAGHSFWGPARRRSPAECPRTEELFAEREIPQSAVTRVRG
jgi:hypothetical protein